MIGALDKVVVVEVVTFNLEVDVENKRVELLMTKKKMKHLIIATGLSFIFESNKFVKHF